MLPEVEVTTCQGIGDCLWVFQCLAPHVSGIRWNILHAGAADPARQTRATSFLHLLPKTISVTGKVVSHEEYRRVSSGRFSLRDLLDAGAGDYACNAALEAGVRIEDIEPGYAIEERVAIRTAPHGLPFDEYVAVYVSGSTMCPKARKANSLWDISQWLVLLDGFWDRYSLTLPAVVLGASYDREAATVVADRLRGRVRVEVLLDEAPARVCGVLKGCRAIVAYQSGLSILTDQLSEAKSLMIYFPTLDGLRLSWPRRCNITSAAYQSALMSQAPRQVLDALPWASL